MSGAQALYGGCHGPACSCCPTQTTLSANSLADFLLSRQSALLSPRTIGFYIERLSPFLSPLGGRGGDCPTDARGANAPRLPRGGGEAVRPGDRAHVGPAIRAWVHFLEVDGYVQHHAEVRLPTRPLRRAQLGPLPRGRAADPRGVHIGTRPGLRLVPSRHRRTPGRGAGGRLGGREPADGSCAPSADERRPATGRHPRGEIRRALLRYRRALLTPTAIYSGRPATASASHAGLREVLRRTGDRAAVRVTPRTPGGRLRPWPSAGVNFLHLAALMGTRT